jgi:regulator of ribonuclease activity A
MRWMSFTTADLFDEYGPELASCETQFRSYGARERFAGPLATVRCLEDNALLKKILATPGEGRVLVIDGGGSLRIALLGDNIASIALENGWAGIVLNACVRDSAVLRTLAIGIKALGTHPKPSSKTGEGEVDVPVTFGGVTFTPGARVVCDDDGVVVVP